MIVRKMVSAAAALTLIAAPAMAQAANADRASAPAKSESKVAGTTVILGVLALIALGGGIFAAVDSKDNTPASM